MTKNTTYQFWTGSEWIKAAHIQAPEGGKVQLFTAPTTEGWRVEIGDSDYPIRYWDGTDTRFSVDDAGDVSIAGAINATSGTISGTLDVSGLIKAPPTGWRVEIGDDTYPLRYWDGSTTNFRLDNAGGLYGRSMLLNQYNDTSVILSLQTTSGSYNTWVQEVKNSSGGRVAALDETGIFYAYGKIRVQENLIGGLGSADNGSTSYTTLRDAGQIELVNNSQFSSLRADGSGNTQLFSGSDFLWGNDSTPSRLKTGGSVQLREISTPGTPSANAVYIYAKDRASVSRLYYKSDAGTEYLVNQAAAVTGPLTSTTTVSNTSTETALLTYTVPANLAAVGTTWRLVCWGTIDNIATSGTLTFALRWGGTSGVTLATRQVVSQASGATDNGMWLDGLVTVRTTGATGSASGVLNMRQEFSSTNRVVTNTTPDTVATNSSKDLVLTAKWATADAGNIVRAIGGYVELIQP